MGLFFPRFPTVFFWLVGSVLAACSPRVQVRYAGQNSPTTAAVDARVAPDSSIAALIAPYKSQVDAKMNRVIGQAASELTKVGIESALGNFIADLSRQQATKHFGRPVDMGMTASGGLRVPIAAGDVTVGDIFELMPFENELWVLTLDGAMTEQLFRHLAKVKNLSISNAQVTLQNGELQGVLIHGKPLQKDTLYTLATTDYLASGGDGLDFLKAAKAIKPLNVKFRDAIIDHIENLTRQGKLVDARVEGRVQVRE